MRGWAKFNSENRGEVEESLAVTVDALHAAQGYGAGVILLVPGRLNVEPMPKPWEFRLEFDHRTGHLTKVAEKDNERYREYIAAHNRAYDAFQGSIGKLIQTAEKTGVVIALENVWSNLFVDPRHAAHFVDSFESPWVRTYFDIGNHVKYSRPEQWIEVLGKRIVRCHVKDFKLNRNGRGGKFVNIREGSVDWASVMKALEKVGYQGWMTIEGSEKLSLAERSRRLDLIIAGK
jgi:hexulose-6-phosphate isomerase